MGSIKGPKNATMPKFFFLTCPIVVYKEGVMSILFNFDLAKVPEHQTGQKQVLLTDLCPGTFARSKLKRMDMTLFLGLNVLGVNLPC
jgi:hypothetical protein